MKVEDGEVGAALLGLARCRQHGVVSVDDEYSEQLCRLRLAGIGADVVLVTRQLGEVLTGGEGLRFAAVDGALDCALEHRGVDQRGFGMRMGGAIAAGPVLNEDAFDALARNVGQGMLVDQSHLGILRVVGEPGLGDIVCESRVQCNDEGGSSI